MKAMILAAGRGQRMRPLTDTTPKPLLQVKQQCLIDYLIQQLVAAGIKQLVINTCWLGEQIESHLGDGTLRKISIVYSREPPTSYETGGGIYHALPLLSDPFIAVNADLWTDYDFAKLPTSLSTLGHLVLVDNPPHHLEGDFSLDNGYIRSGQALTFSGIGMYRHALFSGCQGKRFPLAPLLHRLAQDQQLSGEHYSGRWHDVGTPEQLSLVNRLTNTPD